MRESDLLVMCQLEERVTEANASKTEGHLSWPVKTDCNLTLSSLCLNPSLSHIDVTCVTPSLLSV